MNLRLQFSIAFAIACWLCAAASATKHLVESRHVVVVVWDGMRPDFVSEKNAPTLWKLALEGITFRNHHALYPSATNVNGAGLVTGVYPGKNGIIANHVYRPEIDARRTIDVEVPAVVEKGDALSGGKYLLVPTLSELVLRAGGRTVVASAKTVGLLLDRSVGHASGLPSPDSVSGTHALSLEDRVKNHATLFAGKSLPPEIVSSITEKLGAFPSTRVQQNAWTTKALTEFLWKTGVPALSILWLGEPDLTQHEKAPGSPEALAAIKSSDENFAAVLAALDERGVRASTDVFVVSDHGFSTIQRSIDLRKILNDAGFAAKLEFDREPQPGDIMLAGNGGTVLFYVVRHDEKLIRRLVEFLQQSDFAGVIFTKNSIEGTFSLDEAKIASDHSPDVVMAFRWNDSNNQFDVRGMIDADWQRGARQGTHATLSRFDMHNTLIAAGPDFKRGETDDLPSGTIDLAPTILQILGISLPGQMDGRILSEAMVNAGAAVVNLKAEIKTTEAAKDFASGRWQQSLQISRVGSTVYLDEGNGEFLAKQGTPGTTTR